VSEAYHRGELAVALDATHPSHILPPAVDPSGRVLDIGCGAGQTLIAAYSDRVSFGVDPDHAALKLGRSMSDRVRFVCAGAEALPWQRGSFDLVIARVSLPYTDLRLSIREIRRVLAVGGTVWMTLHPFSMAWRQARRGNLKGWLYFVYIVTNSLMFHFLQRQFHFRGRCESFQTEYGIRIALEEAGFVKAEVRRGRHFVVTARAASRSQGFFDPPAPVAMPVRQADTH
jgi:SAM-dependent methyltransferase